MVSLAQGQVGLPHFTKRSEREPRRKGTGSEREKGALSENLTEYAYYAAFAILRTARSSRLLTARRLALSSR